MSDTYICPDCNDTIVVGTPHDCAAELYQQLDSLRDGVEEWNKQYGKLVVGLHNEYAFATILSHVNLLTDEGRKVMGDLMWNRLRQVYQVAPNSVGDKPDRKGIAYNKLVEWANVIGTPPNKLYLLVRAARNREVVPEIGTEGLTVQAEIGQNASDDDEERRSQILKKRDSLDELDPERQRPVDTIRRINAFGKMGIVRPTLIYYKDLERGGTAIDGLMPDGVFERVARLEDSVPKNGDYQDAVKEYWKLIMRRLPAQARDAMPFEPIEEGDLDAD